MGKRVVKKNPLGVLTKNGTKTGGAGQAEIKETKSSETPAIIMIMIAGCQTVTPLNGAHKNAAAALRCCYDALERDSHTIGVRRARRSMCETLTSTKPSALGRLT